MARAAGGDALSGYQEATYAVRTGGRRRQPVRMWELPFRLRTLLHEPVLRLVRGPVPLQSEKLIEAVHA
jgi:hypothetical protein